MAVQLTQLRNALTSKVFNSTVATTVTITPITKGSSSDGGFTPAADSEGSSFTVKAIPYSNTTDEWFKTMFGESDTAESSVIVPQDTSVSIGDKISWLSNTYYVEDEEEFVYGNGVVAKQLRVNDRISTS